MEIKTTDKIKKVQADNFFWLDITDPGEEEIEFLQKTFDFHPLDIEDVRQKTLRSKIDKYTKYIFLVLIFPTYNKEAGEINASEVEIFLGHDYLVTIHEKKMALFKKLYDLCQIDQKSKHKILGLSPEKLMYEILDKLYTCCLPMLDHINVELEDVEKQIFAKREKKMVEEILAVRRNITDFRKIMHPHKQTLRRMLNSKNDKIFGLKSGVYFDDLTDHAKEIWDSLETFKELVEALHETNESLISHKLNKTMRILTAVSIILLPMGIIASFWGMNVNVPFADHAYGFWTVFAITIAMGLIIGIYFRLKKWL